MLDTSARLLALLSLLQSRPRWTGPELAQRLGVAARTVRADIVRLRALGYTVEAEPGRAGHYRLGGGANLPPLLLDDEEAVAVTIGLRAGLAGIGNPDSGARALAKLERILPQRLRRTVAALHDATAQARENTDTDADDPVVDPAVLARLAAAIRDHRSIRFTTAPPGTEPEGPVRLAEAYRMVSWQRRWYVVVREQLHDPPGATWTVLRVDWLELRVPDGPVFTPQPEPEDATDLVMRQVAAEGWLVRARIAVDAPAARGTRPHPRRRRRGRDDRRRPQRPRHRRRQPGHHRRLHRHARPRLPRPRTRRTRRPRPQARRTLRPRR